MDMIFKPMDESHIDRLLKIGGKMFPGRFMDKINVWKWSKEQNFFIYCCFVNRRRSYSRYCCVWFIADFAEITNIAVSPEFWRQGIGKTILYYIIEKSKKNKCKYINLEVKSTNIAAISLYEKMGFVSVGQRKKYYKDNSDAILMTKDL